MDDSQGSGFLQPRLLAGREERNFGYREYWPAMTILQLYLFDAMYLAIVIAVAYFTRATRRRLGGALAGGAVISVVALGIIALGERAGLWHMVIRWEPYFLTLFLIGLGECAFIYLLTWRIARRFGAGGLAVAVTSAAIIGPPRDYWYMARFPEWGTYAPGLAPVIAISATYAVIVGLGHAVMWLVAGPSDADPLASRGAPKD
jgi:hypothetical protein